MTENNHLKTVNQQEKSLIPSKTESIKEEIKKEVVEQEKPLGVINKRILRKFRHFWKLGIKEFNTQYFDINQNGELIVLEGNYQYNVKDLVEKYGSPLKVFFPSILKERLEDLIDIFRLFIKYYKYRGKFYYHYPMKVNQNKEYILSLVAEG
ncbi:hypothetical protein KKF32_03510, partial [Patescibacteria group bacterium]|nr:hypothetical protein [Patescibacteria group bacterium]